MGRIIVITSGKGGVGKSTIACGCGAALAKQRKKVLLIDGDIGLRSLDAMLGTSERTLYHWKDILDHQCEKKDAIIQVSNLLPLYLLSSPLVNEEEFNMDSFRELCLDCAKKYDFVMIDSSAGLGKEFSLAACSAQESLVVVTPDPVSIRAAEETANRLRNDFGLNSKMILNRFRTYPIFRWAMPNIDDAIDQTGMQLLGVVPEDREIGYQAAHGKLYSASGKAPKAFERIVRRLQGEEVPLKHLVR